MQKAAEYFNVDYRTIQRHLDTKLATKQNAELLYFFSSEISFELKCELLKKLSRVKNAATEV
jgi:hypothetical protein